MRQAGLVQKAAVLIAVGVDEAGKRTVLGVSVALSEHEVHWRTFLQSLVARGLCGVRLVIALLMEIRDDWQAGKAYLTFSH